MSTWNYRVMEDEDGQFTLREVYYTDEKEIQSWTGEVAPFGESEEELRNDLDYMLRAFNLPILSEVNLTANTMEKLLDDIKEGVEENDE